MKRLLLAAWFAISSASAHAEVGVSVNIGHPGFYGRLDIGDYPPPALIYSQPIVIERAGPGVGYAPIYLRVPPGHARHWARHCYRYRACNRPVYFVQDNWYRDVYVPRHRELHGRPYRRYDERAYPPHPHRTPGPHAGPGFPPSPRPDYRPFHGPGPGFGPGRLPGPP